MTFFPWRSTSRSETLDAVGVPHLQRVTFKFGPLHERWIPLTFRLVATLSSGKRLTIQPIDIGLEKSSHDPVLRVSYKYKVDSFPILRAPGQKSVDKFKTMLSAIYPILIAVFFGICIVCRTIACGRGGAAGHGCPYSCCCH